MHRRSRAFLAFFVIPLTLSSCAVVGSSAVPDKYKNKSFVERVYPAPEKYVQIKNFRVCYIEKGTGPTLLILPGLSLGAHNWRFNVARYWDKFHVILLDFPGYGKSDAPDVDYSIEFFKETVLEFMKKKGIEHAAILGHSLGGQVGIVIAAQYPQIVDALILETATGVRPRFGVLEDIAIRLYVTADRFATLPEQKLREYTEINFYAPVPAQEELIDYQLLYRIHCGHTEIFRARNEAFTRGAVNIILTDVRPYVPKIKAPTLILWGKNDRLDDVSNAYWLYRNIPNAQLYVIEHCGHQPHLEKPVIYDFAITRFLGEWNKEWP